MNVSELSTMGSNGEGYTSSKQRPLSPIHSKHTPRSKANTLRKVDTPPEIHSQHTTSEVQPPKVENSSVTDIRQTTQVSVVECPVDSVVEVTVVDLISTQTRKRGGDLGQLAAQVFTLLVCTLGSCREGC